VNIYHTAAGRRYLLAGLSLSCTFFCSACVFMSTINIPDRPESAVSQSIGMLNAGIMGHTVTVRLKNGSARIADSVQVQVDSTRCHLVVEQKRIIIPTDSILEIVNSAFNFAALPKPTVFGALAGILYTAVFRPTYHDESGDEQRVSIPRGSAFGAFFGLTYGFACSGGTVYRLSNDTSQQAHDIP
jgi:hypothetical protein